MDYMKTLASLSLGSRLKRLSDQLFTEVAVVYEQMGLTLNPNYFLLLNLINKMGPMGITQAAEYLAVSHPAISKLANKMIQEGYLTKHPHPTDKRASQLILTQQSTQITEQATPIWQALKKHLDYLESLQKTPLLDAIEQFENSLKQLNLSQIVLQDLKKPVQNISIVNWHSDYKNDFKRLNMSWLNSEFNGELTVNDQQAIEQPESYYLAQGGYLFFAKQDEQVIGCIALKPISDDCYELSKMAVCPDIQGHGIGRSLLLSALNKARDLNIQKISLETNSKLLRAMALYQHFGFTQMPHPKGQSDYARADVYMELQLYV
ncbi:bifunctional helix-turn-helix transcriptional regulator/GNAT family N-acetyltransferase [Psychromonas sp. Urea-02u-13]|uniref:bifunctional helix-turn-helix transcriptional regulator/GNAT family N-acetyltransferase n=1 Tax=Psychromonas sp. Urea-02u-13 TaxID=2058326 RepID=UPI000C32A897|nr:bifunctional helix-turn-helix transcriptional regulator/GNAT family N-acetyltransferase [Psychromonas sp. Urea-02u-13]PKG39514.1 GNAT family N-acetyltransferase [Psychromonas sp. Urea-02u-13]